MAYVFAFTLDQGLPGLWEGWLLAYVFVLACNLLFVLQSDWLSLTRSAKTRAEMRSLSSTVTDAGQHLSSLRQALLDDEDSLMVEPSRQISVNTTLQ
jgi:hypothetical protein